MLRKLRKSYFPEFHVSDSTEIFNEPISGLDAFSYIRLRKCILLFNLISWITQKSLVSSDS